MILCVTENWKIDSNLCLTVINGIDKDIQHPCQRNNGGCSHLCLLTAKEKVTISVPYFYFCVFCFKLYSRKLFNFMVTKRFVVVHMEWYCQKIV